MTSCCLIHRLFNIVFFFLFSIHAPASNPSPGTGFNDDGFSLLKMETAGIYETSVATYGTTWCHNPDSRSLNFIKQLHGLRRETEAQSCLSFCALPFEVAAFLEMLYYRIAVEILTVT
jgi:hypothetical protein